MSEKNDVWVPTSQTQTAPTPAANPQPQAAPTAPQYHQPQEKGGSFLNNFVWSVLALMAGFCIAFSGYGLHPILNPPTFTAASAHLRSLGYNDPAADLEEMSRVCSDANKTPRACILSFTASRNMSHTAKPDIVAGAAQ